MSHNMRAFFYHRKKFKAKTGGKPRTLGKTGRRDRKGISQGKVTRRELVKMGLI